ncbi:MAG: hypothetical protein COA42_04985 [Alteromonadaceae bacterium]|nr:MAG: hypothetical protein COA42_04985 [Alteromonadaceae bacterium]
MIDSVLVHFRDSLNMHFKMLSGPSSDDSQEERAAFIDGDKVDPITFKSEAISVILINVEEEKTMRAADPYRRMSETGEMMQSMPDIRLNLYVLFVAKFKQYQSSLEYISSTVQYFQSRRVITRDMAPQLPENIEKLVVELVTLPFNEQNEIWNALRTTYHPSLLYRVKLIQYVDTDARAAKGAGDVSTTKKQISPVSE